MRHDRALSDRGCAVIVFANDDPLPMAFASPEAATGHMEAIDVEDGLYSTISVETGLCGGVYAVDGRVMEVRTADGLVQLAVTTRRDRAGLRQRLLAVAERGLVTGDPDDPVAIARELFEQQWDSRWPKWPKWLDRRLHGDTPPSV